MNGSRCYPISVIQDRYSGTYSGGYWLAIAESDELVAEGNTRAQFCLVGIGGPSDSDVEAATFWANPPDWLAVGRTPEQAIDALLNNRSKTEVDLSHSPILRTR